MARGTERSAAACGCLAPASYCGGDRTRERGKKGLVSILTTMRSSCGGQTRRGSGGAADRRRHRVLGLQWRQLGFRGIKAARVRGGSKGGRGVLYRGGRGCLGVRAKKEKGTEATGSGRTRLRHESCPDTRSGTTPTGGAPPVGGCGRRRPGRAGPEEKKK